jgi:hypothetical protein
VAFSQHRFATGAPGILAGRWSLDSLDQAAHFTTDDFSRHSGLIDFCGRCRRSGRLSLVAKSVKPVFHSTSEPEDRRFRRALAG